MSASLAFASTVLVDELDVALDVAVDLAVDAGDEEFSLDDAIDDAVAVRRLHVRPSDVMAAIVAESIGPIPPRRPSRRRRR